MDSVIEWLMQGDAAIRWQTLRDLGAEPLVEWQLEREKTVRAGWCARLLDFPGPDGAWPEGRWTGTIWTLLTLLDCGIPPGHPPILDAARLFLEGHLTPARAVDEEWLLTRVDLCHLGFWLRIRAYFMAGDCRLKPLSDTVLQVQMPNGGWNCRQRNYPQTHHSSFHTTFNVLEGLSAATEVGAVSHEVFFKREARALEFMLRHQMYRSDRTGEIVHERFNHLSFPSRWHFTVLRGLDYMRLRPAIRDPRLEDPLALLVGRKNTLGRWPVEKRIPGKTFFDMEKMGEESRWNTLRALRVLRCRERELAEQL